MADQQAAGDKECDALTEEHEAQQRRQAGHVDVLEVLRAVGGYDRRDVAPTEGGDELGDGKDHDHEAGQAFHRFAHHLHGDVAVGDLSALDAEGEAHGQEEEKEGIGTMPRISGELRMVPVFGFRSRAPSGTIMKSRTPMKISVAHPVAFKALISRSVQGSSEKFC